MYGIFLDELMRQRYGMSNPRYATVEGFATVGANNSGTIVEAIPVRSGNFYLTGLVVDVSPDIESPYGTVDNWARLDRLEGAYDRIKVDTTDGQECWMYVCKGSVKQ